MILGARKPQVSGFGGSPLEVMNLFTTQEPHELTQAAGAPWPARYVIWMAVGARRRKAREYPLVSNPEASQFA